MNLTTMTADVREAVKDLDAGGYVWTDAEVTGAIDRALARYSAVASRLGSKLFSGTGALKSFDVGTEAGFQYVVAVEHPVDQAEPAYLRFEERGPGLALVIGDAPTTGTDNVRVWYSRFYASADATWATPAADDPTIQLGAVAFLLVSAARYYTGRFGPSQSTSVRVQSLADVVMEQFEELLVAVAARGVSVGRRPVWGADA